MKRLLYFIAIFLIFSCSNESIDESLINSNPFNVFGKIIAPNGIDPISEGKVSVISNNTIVQEVFSDSRGNFSFFLNYGNYDLVISKGLFKTESSISLSENSDSFNFNLGDISFDQFPSIGVVTGYYDNIESILYDIGLVNPIDGTPLFDIIDGIDFNRNSNEIYNRNHGNHRVIKNTSKTTGLEPNVDFNFSDLLNNVSLLNQYDVLFLNCGLNTDEAETNESLYNFVNNGGILYATDWTYPFLEKFKTELHLESAAGVFPLIEKIITKSVKFVKKEHSDLQMDYNLDNSRMKKLLKTYFNYFFWFNIFSIIT